MFEQDEIHTFSAEGKWSSGVLKYGFTIVPNLLISSRRILGLTPTELYIFIAIDSYRWDSLRAPFPSLNTLAAQTGLHRQTIYRATKKLEMNGLIEKYRNYSRSNTYDLRLADDVLLEVDNMHKGIYTD